MLANYWIVTEYLVVANNYYWTATTFQIVTNYSIVYNY